MGQSKYNMLKFAISYGKIAAILAIITLVMTTYYTASQINEYWVRAFLIFRNYSCIICGISMYEVYLSEK